MKNILSLIPGVYNNKNTLIKIRSLSLPLFSYAGEWKEDNIGKWYQNNDATYPVSQWKWIEFNNGGTPDNYTVNENGAWIENGLIVTWPVGSSTKSANGSVENNTSQNTSGGLSEYEKQFHTNYNSVLDERELINKNFHETHNFDIGRGGGLRDWQ